VDQVGGSIAITGLDGDAVYDLSNITAGADGDGAGDDTAGTVTATISADTTVTLDAATNLGNATLLLEETTTTAVGNDLIVNATAAQVDGRTVTGTDQDELLVVDLDGASATLDLSNVADAVSLEASVSESIDLTGMNLGGLSAITAQDGDAGVQSAINVTMTALQADAIGGEVGGEVLTAGELNNTTLDDDTVSVTVTAATAVNADGEALAVDGTGVNYTGSVGNDTLNGTQAKDTIDGGEGNDTINGGTGDDTITGGAGADTLDGGAGDDTFTYTAVTESGVGAGNRDIISNFEDANLTGGDVIDLSAIAGMETSGDASIEWLGTDAFSATGTSDESVFEARYAVSGDNAVVEIDTTGDGAADMQIELTGVTQLTAGDFVLMSSPT
jgi:Ca2+-binding RTX toxin-like protein